MDRSERFYRIEALIKSRGCVDFATLLAELEVSPATLKRDIQYLRDRMDAPIVWDAFDRGYKLQSASARSPVQHELPGVWFSEREIHALLTMHQLIQGLDEGGLLSRHLQPLLDKLRGMLGPDDKQAQSLMRRVRIISAGRRPVPSKWFELFGEKEQLLRFALDAVEQASILELKAREVPVKTVETALDAGYGIFAGSRTQWATLVFSENAARWVGREEWHPRQRSRHLPDGRFELRVPYANETELVMDVLRHGSEVEVLAPDTLRTAVQAQLKLALKSYAAA